jgi:hypothetical protein
MGVFFFIVRPELSYNYRNWLRDISLPRLTDFYALPVLGPSIDSFSGSPVLLFYVFWTVVFAPPLVILFFLWRAKDRVALLEIAVYWGSIYANCVIIAFIFVALGLWLPFAVT